MTSRLNDLLAPLRLGAFHCGVEVLGDEWFFAWGETDLSGVVWNEPRQHQVHIYRQTVNMGESELSEGEIHDVIRDAMDNWIANGYHPITRNCVTFAEELTNAFR